MDLTSIPERGTLYALYLDKVKYEKYSRKELLEDRQLTEKLLELHLFNVPESIVISRPEVGK